MKDFFFGFCCNSVVAEVYTQLFVYMKLNTTTDCVFEIVYTLCNITASKHMKETQVNSSEVLRPLNRAP